VPVAAGGAATPVRTALVTGVVAVADEEDDADAEEELKEEMEADRDAEDDTIDLLADDATEIDDEALEIEVDDEESGLLMLEAVDDEESGLLMLEAVDEESGLLEEVDEESGLLEEVDEEAALELETATADDTAGGTQLTVVAPPHVGRAYTLMRKEPPQGVKPSPLQVIEHVESATFLSPENVEPQKH
jgi:hypothetical protein